MKTQPNPTPPPSVTAERADLIPLATLAGEFASMPTLDDLAARLGDDVQLDAIGRRCITAELATVLLDSERERRVEAVERARARVIAAKSKPRRPKVRPVPLPDGMTLRDVMMADFEAERGPVGFDRFSGAAADSGVMIGPARRPRRRDREATS